MCDCERVHVLLEQFGTVEHELTTKPPFTHSLRIPYAFR